MSTGVIAIVSIVIWIAVSKGLVKSSKELNRRKLFTLMCAGSISTLIITISFFQNIQI
ncbi:hypothetical protein [Metabacillus malikii]|uniref:Uncharacterized protein n=1 Tax=Metabacillus malikii TaxID=1504265 RepID=A0ABT9ZD41_9BACI|nr:hypothetical protein [Metabacillus malikii]MDQ0230168.1 hypothetical protein [Metabacillus malikii]